MSKLKVGFLTTHRCDNYGSVLQSFAFQTKLIEWGYDVELIDFYHKENTIRGQLESLKTKLFEQYKDSLISMKQSIQDRESVVRSSLEHCGIPSSELDSYVSGASFILSK